MKPPNARFAPPAYGTGVKTASTVPPSLSPAASSSSTLHRPRHRHAQPDILLMDEPCSALDPIATHRIEELMGTLRKQVTIVIVTHNMHQAMRVADTTAFFYMGKLMSTACSRHDFSQA